MASAQAKPPAAEAAAPPALCLADMPKDVLVAVLNQLPPTSSKDTSRLSALCVSKRWHEAGLAAGWRVALELTPATQQQRLDLLLERARSRTVTDLRLSCGMGDAFPRSSAPWLARLPLHSLAAYMPLMGDDAMWGLPTRELRVLGFPLRLEQLAHVRAGVSKLVLKQAWRIEGARLPPFKPGLEELHLLHTGQWPEWGQKDRLDLSALSQLTKLCLNGKPRVLQDLTDCAARLRGPPAAWRDDLPRMRELHLRHMSVEAGSMYPLKLFPGLRVLHIAIPLQVNTAEELAAPDLPLCWDCLFYAQFLPLQRLRVDLPRDPKYRGARVPAEYLEPLRQRGCAVAYCYSSHI